jgi:hypothetical protein
MELFIFIDLNLIVFTHHCYMFEAQEVSKAKLHAKFKMLELS